MQQRKYDHKQFGKIFHTSQRVRFQKSRVNWTFVHLQPCTELPCENKPYRPHPGYVRYSMSQTRLSNKVGCGRFGMSGSTHGNWKFCFGKFWTSWSSLRRSNTLLQSPLWQRKYLGPHLEYRNDVTNKFRFSLCALSVWIKDSKLLQTMVRHRGLHSCRGPSKFMCGHLRSSTLYLRKWHRC